MRKNESYLSMRLPKEINLALKKEAEYNNESKSLRARKILIVHFIKGKK
jgi:hypothetical protein